MVTQAPPHITKNNITIPPAKMILIGSQALNMYLPVGRKMHDWDFIMTHSELQDFHVKYKKYHVKETEYSLLYDIDGTIVEVRNPKTLEFTDEELIKHEEVFDVKDSRFGKVSIPDIQKLYDIKKSTALYIDEPKHWHDVKLIEDNFTVDTKTGFFELRSFETRDRVAKSTKVKYDFFHKYHIPEYILHDRLHDMIAELLDIPLATYKRTISADVERSEELFNKLTHNQMVSLMVEESLVLNLERWFIPQNVENGINYRLIEMFYNNNEAMPTYLILKHCNVTGLKGEAKWVTDFSKANFFEIENAWIVAKEKIRAKGGFPDWFFNELFEQRDLYKKKSA